MSYAYLKQLYLPEKLTNYFFTDKTYLSFKIGSQLLDRRIYCFPSRRDFKIGVPQSKAMMDIYEECLDLKGIVLTLPEYRLSADLKAFERCEDFTIV